VIETETETERDIESETESETETESEGGGGGPRFHIFPPGFQYTYLPNTLNPDFMNVSDYWYVYYDQTIRRGKECCASKSISFHDLYVEDIYAIYDYLYHCKREQKIEYYQEYTMKDAEEEFGMRGKSLNISYFDRLSGLNSWGKVQALGFYYESPLYGLIRIRVTSNLKNDDDGDFTKQ
jgi:hypothetical protein